VTYCFEDKILNGGIERKLVLYEEENERKKNSSQQHTHWFDRPSNMIPQTISFSQHLQAPDPSVISAVGSAFLLYHQSATKYFIFLGATSRAKNLQSFNILLSAPLLISNIWFQIILIQKRVSVIDSEIAWKRKTFTTARTIHCTYNCGDFPIINYCRNSSPFD